MTVRPFNLPLIAGFLLSGLAAPALANDKPLLQEGKQTLYQRVLTTPSCQLADSAGATAGKAQPAFTRFYVYQREQSGNAEWLKVGPDSYGKTVGWIKADCAVDWKMQMTLALTNPAGRDPLLFFKDKAKLEELFAKEDPTPLLKPIQNNMKDKGRDPAVVAREPDYAVDLAKNFYLLPVLDAEEVYTEKGFQVRLLNVASVSAEPSDKSKADASNATANEANTLKGFSAAVVFVIDSTISMGPYIDRTREAVKRIYGQIEQEKLLDQVKFGLVAYRSSTKAVPQLEYTSKMFADPSTVKDGKDFLAKVAELKQASASSSSFDEDTYAGVMQALDQVKWNEFGARYIVLVTDAGALDGDNKLSSTGLSAEQVRLEAKYRGVAIYSLHLKTPSGAKNHASAEAQYTDLSTNAFLNKPLYYPVDAGNVDSFGSMVDSLGDAITAQVKAAYRGDMAAGSALGADTKYAGDSATDKAIVEDAALLGHAMRLAYLGEKTGASAPPVFQAWISDRDFVQQNVPTTDVRVLMTKSQLSDLSDVVKQIADAANEGLISPNDMFERLRSVAATMGKDPNQLKDKTIKVADMGLMAEYLDGLPYLSDVLSLDEETWKGMEGLDQEKFIRRLNTKLKYYQRYNADADRWVSLAPGSDAREHVYPVPLEALP
ncbi:MAG: vWA domain-containing protein [Pseudomonas sp.]|uniref:vWA domain-containing protein n=1 Tax=Pseudomonas sp. TaxID=306 RepID=UPI002727635F|nr:vWA domain-containing protein [Pseudomonas sp.]MDO9617514.1 vWA domain-containing protein [Pseudomonas sp.]MDP2443855.1 vWA domain-containing protein [Pseudomonas sp.]MDZ4334486.1 vWA domain-containing protein [Pseudomonas sp.]